MKIAIFGSNGYLGRHLATVLSERGYCCDLFDIHAASALTCGTYHRADITNESFWDGFDSAAYAAILFFAGLSGSELSLQKPDSFLHVNEQGLLNLLKAVKSRGSSAPKIVFPSSRLVYRGGEEVREDSPVETRSVYAATKLACEGLLSAYHYRFQVPYAVLRICVPFGNVLSGEYSYGTLGFFTRQAIAGRPITIYGDGECRKTYVHVLDLCEIVDRVIKVPSAVGVFNVGGHDYSLKEVAEMVSQRYGGHIVSVKWPSEAARIEMGDISLNAAKLHSVIGFMEYKRLENYIKQL